MSERKNCLEMMAIIVNYDLNHFFTMTFRTINGGIINRLSSVKISLSYQSLWIKYFDFFALKGN
jgi:hypothetical protein